MKQFDNLSLYKYWVMCVEKGKCNLTYIFLHVILRDAYLPMYWHLVNSGFVLTDDQPSTDFTILLRDAIICQLDSGALQYITSLELNEIRNRIYCKHMSRDMILFV